MTYYRRATVYLAMGRAKSAVQDLTRVVELKPDFSAVCKLFFISQAPLSPFSDVLAWFGLVIFNVQVHFKCLTEF
jgi:hypothetical protein